jgi:hypothetical protein
MVRSFREKDAATPVVLMGYANPVERYDLRRTAGAFIRDAAAAGVDGVLVVDYPPEECEAFAAELKAQRPGPDLPAGADQHRRAHAAGRAHRQRLRVLRFAQGRDRRRPPRHRGGGRMLPRIRKHVKVPVGVGFGIRDADTAKAVGRVADAVVIGTKVIQLVEDQPREKRGPALPAFLRWNPPAARRLDNPALPQRSKTPHELARKTAAPKIQPTDPAERRSVPEGPVDQVPELRDGAVQDRPGAEPERLPQPAATTTASVRAPG